MRYLLLLAAPLLLLSATPPHHAPAKKPAALAPLVAPGTVLTDAQRLPLLSRADLGRLWRHSAQSSTEDVLNGCFGYDGRRLEFVFTTVQAVAGHPGHYVVAGKFRCYSDVTPFRGRIELQQVQRLPADVTVYDRNGATGEPTYCASGSFALQATSSHGLGGQFNGRIALDFQVPAGHRATLASTTNPTTRQGGLLFEGNWSESADGETIPVLWKQGLTVTHQVLSRFEIGERSPVVNPKYARVGWNQLWNNDEWWVEKTVARR